jgi:hypothetical protein
MLHEFQNDKAGSDYYHYHIDDALFDIDCPGNSIQAYATNLSPNFGVKSSSTKV